MNDRLWDEYVPDFAGSEVDQRLLEQVLASDPPEAPATEDDTEDDDHHQDQP